MSKSYSLTAVLQEGVRLKVSPVLQSYTPYIGCKAVRLTSPEGKL